MCPERLSMAAVSVGSVLLIGMYALRALLYIGFYNLDIFLTKKRLKKYSNKP
jgi:hypothetical protein